MIFKLRDLFTQSAIKWWLVAFILANILIRGTGGHNQASRFATMRAMVEKTSFNIDEYKHWTDDYSVAPNGETFSNKAPGPMLLGFPVFWLMDKLTLLGKKDGLAENRPGKRKHPGPAHAIVVSNLMQTLPFAIFCLFLVPFLQRFHISQSAIHWSLLSILFGNTAIIFMNTYFGHAMAGLFVMFTVYSLIKRNYLWVGLGFGMTLLSEYSAATLLPSLLIAIFMTEKEIKKWLLPFISGGILPGLVWIWYHTTTFGSPFQTAVQHENPMFIEKQTQDLLFGMIALKPNIPILYELILGPRRGILFTQPWVLALFGIFVFQMKRIKASSVFFIYRPALIYLGLGLLTLIWLNSGFNGWHAGGSSGPRYLCMVFPAIGLLIAFLYDHIGDNSRKILQASIVVAIVFRGLVYGSEILMPNNPLWSEAFSQILNYPKPFHPYKRLLIFFGLLALAYYRTFHSKRNVKIKN